MTIRYAVGLRRDIEQFLNTVTRQGGVSSIGTILSELVQDIPFEPSSETPSGAIDENDSAIDLPPINQVGSGVRIPTGERREHGTETVHG